MWLDPRSLQSRVGSNTWAKAQQLFLQNRVLALAIEPLTKYGPGRWQVTGKVKGSLARPYEVSCTVYLDNDGELRQWESDCTCPVGLRCKHAVALLLKAAYQGHELVAHHLPQNAATALPAASPAWVKTTSSRPVPSATAEALLVRREGDRAVYLNPLRHAPQGPLKLRLPLLRRRQGIADPGQAVYP